MIRLSKGIDWFKHKFPTGDDWSKLWIIAGSWDIFLGDLEATYSEWVYFSV